MAKLEDKHLYNSIRWKKKRTRQLNKYPLCIYCLKQNRTTLATVVDHVVPHRGDKELFYHGELQSLCSTHHSSSKQSEELLGHSIEIGIDGVPINRMHAPIK